jgi:hypothetical protein
MATLPIHTSSAKRPPAFPGLCSTGPAFAGAGDLRADPRQLLLKARHHEVHEDPRFSGA